MCRIFYRLTFNNYSTKKMFFNVSLLTLQKFALIFLILCGFWYHHKYSSSTDDLKAFVEHTTTSVSNREFDKNLQIFEALDPKLFDTKVTSPLSHPLENLCRYPVIHPDDANIADYIEHKRHLTCKEVLPDVVRFFDGVLYVNQMNALKLFNHSVVCMHRPFAGSLRPWSTLIYHYNSWTKFVDKSEKIYHDQFEVKCFLVNDYNKTYPIYRNAFAQIAPKIPKTSYQANNERVLSIDIIGLDSTSLNMFKRHMPKTRDYFMNTMGAYHLEGYNKVADNSMVNWLPIFTGMRYGNQSADMQNEFLEQGLPLNLEKVPFIWNTMKERRCVTMLNDDPMHFTRGLFHYPWEEAVGFSIKPTDYYFRPWHVYHRQFPLDDTSPFCFNNHPYFKLQLNLVEQMIEMYKNTCHFSFSFFTDITHDDPNNLELMDNTLSEFLQRHYSQGYLNNTVLIIMGDHGHRIAALQYTYIGRIEERAPFFGVYFPKWFRDKHPDIMENLVYNKHRFTSNYDVHQMLKDIVNAKFDPKPDVRPKGVSLFQRISTNRTCKTVHVPENHCLCMEAPSQGFAISPAILAMAHEVVWTYTKDKLKLFPKCHSMLKIEILRSVALTTSQMIQHGVRYPIPEYLERLNKPIEGYIEYYELDYQIVPSNLKAVIRLQYDKWNQKLFVNVPPLLNDGSEQCSSSWTNLYIFCACMAFSN